MTQDTITQDTITQDTIMCIWKIRIGESYQYNIGFLK